MTKVVHALAAVAIALGAYAAFDYTYGLEGRITYPVVAAVVVSTFAAVLPGFIPMAWRAGARLISVLLLAVSCLCVAQVFLGAADRMHTAQAGPAAARNAARAAVGNAETALNEAKASAARAEADARAARKLPRQPASKNARAGSFCDDGCLKRYGDDAKAKADRVTEATDALKQARSGAVTDAKFSPAAWLLPACVDASGIVLSLLAGFLSGRRREAEQEQVAAPVVAEVIAEPVAVAEPKRQRKAKTTAKRTRKPRGAKNAAVSAAAVRAAQIGLTVVK
jgi:hypothetical protein